MSEICLILDSFDEQDAAKASDLVAYFEAKVRERRA